MKPTPRALSASNGRAPPTAVPALVAVIVALASVGCRTREPAARSVADAWQQPPPPAESPDAVSRDDATSAAAPGPNIAVVGGRSISRDWLARELIAAHGLDLLLQRISLEIVRQEASRAGVTATPADVEAEYDLTLKLGEASVPDRTELTPQRRKQLIDQWRAARGVSAEELQWAMQRQALLRKTVAARLVVTQQMLRDEFARMHGSRVECRHIVVASLRDAEKLKSLLDAGEDFAVLARRRSINDLTAEKGGLLPPFSQQDETVPGVLREAAFHLEPGQVSNPIKVDGQCHLLKLERRIPPENVRFEDVRPAVERALRDRRTPVEMEALFVSLQQRAVLRIDDPELRRQYQQRLRDGRWTGPPLRD